MRIINAIFFGSIAALSILTAPVLARTSDAQKTDDKSTYRRATRSNRIPMNHGRRFRVRR